MGFDTKEYTISDTSIPDDFDGIKIVHFSDIHYKRAITLGKIKNIVDEVNLINPDIVGEISIPTYPADETIPNACPTLFSDIPRIIII